MAHQRGQKRGARNDFEDDRYRAEKNEFENTTDLPRGTTVTRTEPAPAPEEKAENNVEKKGIKPPSSLGNKSQNSRQQTQRGESDTQMQTSSQLENDTQFSARHTKGDGKDAASKPFSEFGYNPQQQPHSTYTGAPTYETNPQTWPPGNPTASQDFSGNAGYSHQSYGENIHPVQYLTHQGHSTGDFNQPATFVTQSVGNASQNPNKQRNWKSLVSIPNPFGEKPHINYPQIIKTLEDNIKILERKLEESKQIHEREMKSEAKNYEIKIKQLERKIEYQEGIVRQAQDAAIIMMKETRSYALEDDVIESHLRSRAKNWYNWAKDNAHRDINQILNLGDAERQILWDNLRICMAPGLEGLPLELRDGPDAKATPWILLHAMLANYICSEILAKPFWILEAVSLWERKKQNHERSLGITEASFKYIYSLLRNVNESDAHRWRAQLIRILGPNSQSSVDTPEGKKAIQVLEEAQASYRQHMVQNFLSSPAKWLFRKENDNIRDESLAEDIEDALKFSLQLWGQRANIECYGIEAFADQTFPRYKPNWWELHQSLDEYDERPDLPIRMVIQPAMLAFGNEEGTNYSSEPRVWMRARVWK